MQGTLSEIDIRSILQLIELGQRTGELLVEAYPCWLPTSRGGVIFHQDWASSYSRSEQTNIPLWFVFFVNGRIAYATDSNNNSLERLRDYLRYHKAEEALSQLQNLSLEVTNTTEYACIWLLLENHTITPAQARNIIQNMVQETLFDLLSLHQGSFIFEMGSALEPQLTTLAIAPLVTTIMKQIQQWKQLHPVIQSPSQCPVIRSQLKLQQTLPTNVYKNLERWADGKTSLRQMSRYLNRNLATVARAIYPYIQDGLVQLISPPSLENEEMERWGNGGKPSQMSHVVCIDDDISIGKAVEYIISTQGYQTTAIADPLLALSQVFTLKPDLILCDIAMPKLDGYELCAMLRHSTCFRQTPIIMLTGKEGFIDRVRARMVGATDYLTKPFDENELLMLLEKYLGG